LATLLGQRPRLSYPTEQAPRGNTTDTYVTANGTKVEVRDPYRFLEDPESKETMAWVEAERNLTTAFLKTCKLRDKFKASLEESLNYPRFGLMKRHGDHYYYHHNSGLQNQAVYYKVKEKNSYEIGYDDPTKDSEVFLDPNTMSETGTASVASQRWSPDDKYLAYMVQMGGSDWTTIKIRDAETGEDLLDDVLQWVKFSGVSWTKDSKGFFYSRFDAPKENANETMDKAAQKNQKLQFQKVYYHRVGTPQSQDAMVYKNDDEPDWMFGAGVTNDGKYVLLYTSKDTDDLELLQIADISHGPNQKLDSLLEVSSLVSDWIGGFGYVHNLGTHFYF
jgi:prolyl oligopeptidase